MDIKKIGVTVGAVVVGLALYDMIIKKYLPRV